jgi:hypothetical protein
LNGTTGVLNKGAGTAAGTDAYVQRASAAYAFDPAGGVVSAISTGTALGVAAGAEGLFGAGTDSASTNNNVMAQRLTIVGPEGTRTADVETGDSAKDIAVKINLESAITGVTAEARTTATLSGLVSDGTIGFTIQGSNATEIQISATVTTNNHSSVAEAINDKSGNTGITATLSGDKKSITLTQNVGRIGCDLFPFSLETAEAEQTLMSYVWGDQVERLDRLREAIVAFRENRSSEIPIQLHPANLPDGLGDFLQNAVPTDETPVVIYNTFMTPYLSDKGASFRETIGRWAAARSQPVLWLQWEPVKDFHTGPEYGWCGWTADLWNGQTHAQRFLAWVHPHGSQIQFEPDFSHWPPTS